MSLRCADNAGQLTSTLDGVLYAIENGANVINMSYGSPYYSNTAQNLFNWANQNQIVLIAAAGNDGSEFPQYPAAYNHVISVAATQEQIRKQAFQTMTMEMGGLIFHRQEHPYIIVCHQALEAMAIGRTSMAAPIVSEFGWTNAFNECRINAIRCRDLS